MRQCKKVGKIIKALWKALHKLAVRDGPRKASKMRLKVASYS